MKKDRGEGKIQSEKQGAEWQSKISREKRETKRERVHFLSVVDLHHRLFFSYPKQRFISSPLLQGSKNKIHICIFCFEKSNDQKFEKIEKLRRQNGKQKKQDRLIADPLLLRIFTLIPIDPLITFSSCIHTVSLEIYNLFHISFFDFI